MEYNISTTLQTFVNENRGAFLVYGMLSLLFPILDILGPHYYGKIINKLSTSASKTKNIFSAITPELKMIAGVWLVAQILNTVSSRLDAVMVPKLQSYVRTNLVVNVLESLKSNYKEVEVGELITRIVRLPIIIRDLAHQVNHFILPAFLILLVSVGYYMYIDRGLGMIAIVGIMMIALITKLFVKKSLSVSKTLDEKSNKVHEEIEDMFQNILNVYSSDMTEDEINRLIEYQKEMDVYYTETIQCASKFIFAFKSMCMIMFFMINGYSLYLYSNKKIKLDQVVSVLIVSLYVSNVLRRFHGEIREFVFNIGTLASTQHYLDELNESKLKHSSNDIHINEGDVQLQNVSLNYGNKEVFKNLNLHFKPKEKVGVVGGIGKGKTTLLNVIMGLREYNGSIKIDGCEVMDVDRNLLRKQITYVPQQSKLFNRSIYDNITYGTNATNQEVDTMMNKLHLGQVFGDRSLDELAGKGGSSLSGGQCQIVYIMRCLFKDNPIVLLDEPTASLDEGHKQHVMRLLKKLMNGKTVLMVTHDTSLLGSVDRVVKF